MSMVGHSRRNTLQYIGCEGELIYLYHMFISGHLVMPLELDQVETLL
jgi:hypothetical protein